MFLDTRYKQRRGLVPRQSEVSVPMAHAVVEMPFAAVSCSLFSLVLVSHHA